MINLSNTAWIELPLLNSFNLLGPHGPFSLALDNFRPRYQQQEMTACIEALIDDGEGVFVAESPTGTGKTLAYLVPVIASDKTAIISTATRHLQDQIFYKDIPLAFDALDIKKKICLLKGRSNYLCLHRLHTQASIEVGKNKKLHNQYVAVCEWSNQTATGDINDIDQLEETSTLRPLITSTSDNCLGTECGHFEGCFVRKARLKALDADIVVVNHHLYLANLILKQDGFGQLLPETDVLIFDEAHALPDTASLQLSRSISSRQIAQLIGDLNSKLVLESVSIDELFETQQQLDKQLMVVVRLFGKPIKQDAETLFDNENIKSNFKILLDLLEKLTTQLKSYTDEKEYDLLYQRSLAISELLGECLFLEHEKDKFFCWIDATNMRFVLNQTPLRLDEFGERLSDPSEPVTVLVSATLSSSGDFSYFSNQLSLFQIKSKSWPSPFDFKRQCRLYLPDNLPDPRAPQFAEQLLNSAVNLIEVCKGRTFFLFTSHQAMESTYPKIIDLIDYPVLKQGQRSKQELISQFNQLGNTVLLGTSSFWEGVDVKGPNLSCVIIDKLPFASPDDPVLKARLKRMEQNQQNPFLHFQLPQMIIALKQGIGRLIRDESDIGIIMIGDSRLKTKSYGKRVLNALPAIPITSDWEEVESFARSFRNENSCH